MTNSEGIDLVTFGETMAVLRRATTGPLQHNDALHLSCAGAESTVAVGVARLGHRAVWVGRVGDDEFGELVITALRGAGVEVCAAVDSDRPTGLLLRWPRTATSTRVQYHRRGSAGAALTPADVAAQLARRPRIVHATGITAALGPEARSLTLDVLAAAHDAGAVVSYDVNFRSRLTTVADAADVLDAALEFVDILFCGEDELPVLAAAVGRPAAGLDDLLDDPPVPELVVTRGGEGAVSRVGAETAAQPALDGPVIDVVGAGDAFVAGYLSARLDDLGPADRLRRGVTVAAFGVGTAGDWEGLPTRAELDLPAAPPHHTHR